MRDVTLENVTDVVPGSLGRHQPIPARQRQIEEPGSVKRFFIHMV